MASYRANWCAPFIFPSVGFFFPPPPFSSPRFFAWGFSVRVNSMGKLADESSKRKMDASVGETHSASEADRVLATGAAKLPDGGIAWPPSIYRDSPFAPYVFRLPSGSMEADVLPGSGEDRRHMAHIDELRGVFAEFPEGASERERPVDISPKMTDELARSFTMAVYRRMGYRGRALDIPANTDARAPAFRHAVSRNVKNDCRRQRRQSPAPMARSTQKVTLQDGTVLMPPWGRSDRPRGTSLGRVPTPPLLLPQSVDESGFPGSGAIPNVQTPKRERAKHKDGEFFGPTLRDLSHVGRHPGGKPPYGPRGCK